MHRNLQLSSVIPSSLAVEHVMPSDGVIVITAKAMSPSATCPLCAAPSRRVHSRYVRFVSDLPCTGRGVRLHLVTRVKRRRTLTPDRRPILTPLERAEAQAAARRSWSGLRRRAAAGWVRLCF